MVVNVRKRHRFCFGVGGVQTQGFPYKTRCKYFPVSSDAASMRHMVL